MAELENGAVIKGETNIDIPKHDGQTRIKKVWLQPAAVINPQAKKAILGADFIIIGPGDLFSSIVPNFLANGIPQAIRESRAKKIYVCNLMTKFGETHGFSAADFVEIIEKYLGQDVLDLVILNKKKPPKDRITQYEKQGAQFVSWKKEDFRSRKFTVVEENLLSKKGFIRHDPAALANAILKLL